MTLYTIFLVHICCIIELQASPRPVLNETVCYVSSVYLLHGCISSFCASDSSTWWLLSLFAGQGGIVSWFNTAPPEAHACLACLHPRSNCHAKSYGDRHHHGEWPEALQWWLEDTLALHCSVVFRVCQCVAYHYMYSSMLVIVCLQQICVWSVCTT